MPLIETVQVLALAGRLGTGAGQDIFLSIDNIRVCSVHQALLVPLDNWFAMIKGLIDFKSNVTLLLDLLSFLLILLLHSCFCLDLILQVSK